MSEPRILLINPSVRPDHRARHIPVGLACIGTALRRAGYAPDVLDIDLPGLSDAEVRDALRRGAYDIVGFGAIVSAYKVIKQLAQEVRAAMPNALIVVGNTVATSIPDLLLRCVPEADLAVLGEADRTIVDIVEQWSGGKTWEDVPGIAFRREGTTLVTGKRPAVSRMTDIPFPDYSLFDFEGYVEKSRVTLPEPLPLPREEMRPVPINTARGCPYNCTFCFHAFKGTPYRTYPFNAVIDYFTTLRRQHRVNYLSFWDELTVASPRRTRELCDAVESAGFPFWWSVASRGDVFGRRDLDLLKRCKALGALSLSGALESASPEILRAMHKTRKPEQYVARFVEQMTTAQDAGLLRTTGLVFGYPQETRQTIKMTVDVCRRVGIYPSAGFLLPLPETPMYAYARDRGLIGDEESYLLRIGDRQDLHINLTKMSDSELIDTVFEELIALKDDLGIPLRDDEVVKTTHYRAKRERDGRSDEGRPPA